MSRSDYIFFVDFEYFRDYLSFLKLTVGSNLHTPSSKSLFLSTKNLIFQLQKFILVRKAYNVLLSFIIIIPIAFIYVIKSLSTHIRHFLYEG